MRPNLRLPSFSWYGGLLTVPGSRAYQGPPMAGMAGMGRKMEDLENQGQGGGGPSPFCQHYSGRTYLYSDGRWVTFNPNYGHAYYQFNYTGGAGADPIVRWNNQGLIMAQGETLTQAFIAGRCNATDIPGIQFRLYFQTGPWDGTWDSNGETTRTLVLDSVIDLASSSDVKKLKHGMVTPFEAPADGFLIPFYKPTTPSARNRYFLHHARFLMEAPSA